LLFWFWIPWFKNKDPSLWSDLCLHAISNDYINAFRYALCYKYFWNLKSRFFRLARHATNHHDWPKNTPISLAIDLISHKLSYIFNLFNLLMQMYRKTPNCLGGLNYECLDTILSIPGNDINGRNHSNKKIFEFRDLRGFTLTFSRAKWTTRPAAAFNDRQSFMIPTWRK